MSAGELSKSVVLGITERTFLNKLAHHLQLYKDHFRDLAVRFDSPEAVKSVKAIAKVADGPSLS